MPRILAEYIGVDDVVRSYYVDGARVMYGDLVHEGPFDSTKAAKTRLGEIIYSLHVRHGQPFRLFDPVVQRGYDQAEADARERAEAEVRELAAKDAERVAQAEARHTVEAWAAGVKGRGPFGSFVVRGNGRKFDVIHAPTGLKAGEHETFAIAKLHAVLLGRRGRWGFDDPKKMDRATSAYGGGIRRAIHAENWVEVVKLGSNAG